MNEKETEKEIDSIADKVISLMVRNGITENVRSLIAESDPLGLIDESEIIDTIYIDVYKAIKYPVMNSLHGKENTNA